MGWTPWKIRTRNCFIGRKRPSPLLRTGPLSRHAGVVQLRYEGKTVRKSGLPPPPPPPTPCATPRLEAFADARAPRTVTRAGSARARRPPPPPVAPLRWREPRLRGSNSKSRWSPGCTPRQAGAQTQTADWRLCTPRSRAAARSSFTQELGPSSHGHGVRGL